jgi:hypothetical protein
MRKIMLRDEIPLDTAPLFNVSFSLAKGVSLLIILGGREDCML